LPFTIVNGRKLKAAFLEGSAPALPKNFGASGDVPSSQNPFHQSLIASHQSLPFSQSLIAIR
jgi:D-alanyl-D-alanine carboxypeptidase